MIRWSRFRLSHPADPLPEESVARMPTPDEVVASYEYVVTRQMERAGIPAHLVQLDMLLAGVADDGRPTYTAMVKLLAWEDQAAVRLLLGLPLLEAKIRRALAEHWLSDVSSFAGMWVNPAWAVREGDALRAVRGVLRDVEEVRTARGASTPAAAWSEIAPLAA